MASINYLVQCGAMRSANEEILQERSENLRKAFSRAEAAFGSGPFFKGAVLSNADLAWLPLLHRADIILKHTGYDFLAGLPKAQAWREAILETGIAEKSVALDFEDAFTEFYLSDRTFLGSGKNHNKIPDSKRSSVNCCGGG